MWGKVFRSIPLKTMTNLEPQYKNELLPTSRLAIIGNHQPTSNELIDYKAIYPLIQV